MVKQNKRKGHQDRDKYYRLAKEQGLRSRAAFKLSQMNRKYHFLNNAKVCIDLCAAPGGWSQIVNRAMPSTDSMIVAVDIYPIRAIAPNVHTLIGDINTDKCQADIKRTLNGLKADVVLCDGAPNLSGGGAFNKDSYLQNEMVLSALKCATKHLKYHGSFVTKVYRSKDYTALLWAVKHFFGDVIAVKPSSSRMTSTEIFWVCKDYKAPTSIDDKLLNPKHVFEELSEDEDEAKKKKKRVTIHNMMNIVAPKKVSREGYDMSKLDFTLRNIGSVSEFVDSHDPIKLLVEYTGLSFKCDVCKDYKTDEEREEKKEDCMCWKYLHHPITTDEIKTCMSDLKVLGRFDFKGLLKWRGVMRDFKKEEEESDASSAEGEESSDDSNASDEDMSSDEDKIQDEIERLRLKKLRKKKRLKRKDRLKLSKQRQKIAYGMDQNAVEVPGAMTEEGIFSIKTIENAADLEKVHEIDLNEVAYEDIRVDDDVEEEDRDGRLANSRNVEEELESSDVDSETGYDYNRERDLDFHYDEYLQQKMKSQNKAKLEHTRMAKRNKRAEKKKLDKLAEEDEDMMNIEDSNLNPDKMMQYVQMLHSDDEENDADYKSSGDEQSDDDSIPEQPKEKKSNPLLHTIPESASAKTARWFSNPLFESIGTAATTATSTEKDTPQVMSSDDESDNEKDESLKVKDILASMPKTDKQIRREKRKKAMARTERRKAKKEARDREALGDEYNNMEMEIVTPNDDPEMAKKMELLKAGMGKTLTDEDAAGLEIVSNNLPQRLDKRSYNSSEEEYDSDDYAKTLSIGTMILRPSKTKAFVDASYNRYAWNDPEELPDWFLDDENKNYRPQLPIPPALMEKMRERMMSLAEKPMKKVLQARARKNRRVKQKLSAAKKKAESIANSEMTEAMKLKAISKAMRGQEAKKPEKTYVVARRASTKKGAGGAKGVKLVDRRMRSDKKGTERADKRKKGKGIGGGFVGSKKRRHHS